MLQEDAHPAANANPNPAGISSSPQGSSHNPPVSLSGTSAQSVGSKNVFGITAIMDSTKFLVLMVLCLQNSTFTVLRRYSLGVLKEDYSKVRWSAKIIADE